MTFTWFFSFLHQMLLQSQFRHLILKSSSGPSGQSLPKDGPQPPGRESLYPRSATRVSRTTGEGCAVCALHKSTWLRGQVGAETQPALVLWVHGAVSSQRGALFFNSCSSSPVLPVRLTEPLGSRGVACDVTELSEPSHPILLATVTGWSLST